MLRSHLERKGDIEWPLKTTPQLSNGVRLSISLSKLKIVLTQRPPRHENSLGGRKAGDACPSPKRARKLSRRSVTSAQEITHPRSRILQCVELVCADDESVNDEKAQMSDLITHTRTHVELHRVAGKVERMVLVELQSPPGIAKLSERSA